MIINLNATVQSVSRGFQYRLQRRGRRHRTVAIYHTPELNYRGNERRAVSEDLHTLAGAGLISAGLFLFDHFTGEAYCIKLEIKPSKNPRNTPEPHHVCIR